MNRIWTCSCGAGLEFNTDGMGNLTERKIPCRCPPPVAGKPRAEPEPSPHLCLDCPAELTHPNAKRCQECGAERNRESARRYARERSDRRRARAAREARGDGPRVPGYRLLPEQVKEIARLRNLRVPVKDLMERFRVSRTTIERAVKRAA